LGSVEAGHVGVVAQSLLHSLLAAKDPVPQLLEQVDDALEQGRAENLVGEVDEPHSDVGEEVLESRVNDEGVHGLVEPGALFGGLQEGVKVLEESHDGVGDGSVELVDGNVGHSLSGGLEEVRGGEQQTRDELHVARKVQEAHGLLNVVGGERVRRQRVDGSVVLGQLGGIGARNVESVVFPGHQLGGGGGGQTDGRESNESDGRELHFGEQSATIPMEKTVGNGSFIIPPKRYIYRREDDR
jgi:hypothetical protein